MSLSILEVLQNADFNLRNSNALTLMIAKGQLHNAVTLLEKGYSLEDEFDALMEGRDEVEEVPEKGL